MSIIRFLAYLEGRRMRAIPAGAGFNLGLGRRDGNTIRPSDLQAAPGSITVRSARKTRRA